MSGLASLRMRLRLFHKLALVTTILIALTVLAIAGIMIRNLRSGFNAYLDERDAAQLKVFASVVGDALAQGKATPATLGANFALLLDEQAKREDVGPARRPRGEPEENQPPDFPPPGMGQDRFADPEANPGNEIDAEPGRRRSPPRQPLPGAPVEAGVPPAAAVDRNGFALPMPAGESPGSAFGSRVSVLSPDGMVLAGPKFPTGVAALEEAVVVKGKLVARVQLLRLRRASQQLDDKFLRSQYIAIAFVSGLAFVVSLGGILLFSRRLVAPLRSAQTATEQIAHGDFSIRLAEHGGDEVADLVRNINAMARSLETLEYARRNWLAQLSHELRTPLTVLQGECEAMIDGIRPVNAASIAGLHDRVLALKRIVEDLHTVSLGDLGALPHEFAETDAAALVRHVLAGGQTRLTRQGVSVAFVSAADTIPVQWDARRIEQLLENLLENTVRYTDAPGRLEVHLAADSRSVTLRWEDSAPGVSPDVIAQLFEPLYRADAARSRKAGGSGLGLAICRAIVSAHLGKIEAEASSLGGVCIVVTLPRDPAAHDRRS